MLEERFVLCSFRGSVETVAPAEDRLSGRGGFVHRIGDPARWKVDLADVPHPGERIGAGRPICTVFARGRTAHACRTALAAAAGRVYRATEARSRRVGAA